MLDCSRMTNRVHTILSILAEDHAPAALRPSILLTRDLGTDLEAWRKAMRGWTASESSRPR